MSERRKAQQLEFRHGSRHAKTELRNITLQFLTFLAISTALWALAACRTADPMPEEATSPDTVRDYPGSMQDFVEQSALIVRATVLERNFLGWTTRHYSGPDHSLLIEAPDAASIRGTPFVEVTAMTEGESAETVRRGSGYHDWTPYSAYRLRVDQVYRASPAVTTRQEIILHKVGTLEEGGKHGGPTPPLAKGSAYLFALVQAPDRVNFSQHFAGASCLALGGHPEAGDDTVYEMWNRPTPVRFTSATRVDAFVAELKAALAP